MKIYSLIEFTLPPEMQKLETLAIILIIGIVIHRHYIVKNVINNTYRNRTFLYCVYVLLVWLIWFLINGVY
jgi:hypothetical protein